jgi:hypothetical protein
MMAAGVLKNYTTVIILTPAGRNDLLKSCWCLETSFTSKI